MPAIVAFDGLNGTGKTTIARNVSHRLGVEYVRTPPLKASVLREFFDDDPFSRAALLFYASWVVRLSEEVRSGKHGDLVVCDRYVGSTLSYFSAAGNAAAEGLLGGDAVLRPCLTVLVVANEDARISRLAVRSRPRLIETATRRKGFRASVLQRLREYQPLYQIDTTEDSVEMLSAAVANRIVALVGTI